VGFDQLGGNSEKTPISQRRKASLIVVGLAAGMGAVIGSAVVNHSFAPNRATTFDQVLMQTASTLNQSLPMMVDAETRLDNVAPGPGKNMVYRYTMINYSKDANFSPTEFAAALRPVIRNQYLTSEGLKSFRDGGVTMHYHYSDKDGVYLAEITVGPQDAR
jgi:hypothetical protein